MSFCRCCRPLRRSCCASLTIVIPLIIASSTLYLLWQLHFLPLTSTGNSSSYGNGLFYRRLGEASQGETEEIDVNYVDDLDHRVEIDLETKCERQTPYEYPDEDLPLCPCVPPGLEGKKDDLSLNVTEEEVIIAYPDVTPGGRWRPESCVARQHLCVLIPYRDRIRHVMPFMKYIHGRLQRQQRDYSVYLIEQSEGSRFNRGLLFNVGAQYATNTTWTRSCDCIVLHDLDMISEDERNLYMCPPGGALHMAAYRQHLNYSLPYVGYFGGITTVLAGDYRGANGYSNMYFGWGSEDDEFLQRLFATGIKLMRHLPEVSRVKMMEHGPAEPNRERLMLYLRWKERWSIDGLSNIQEVVDVTDIQEMPLYTWIRVEVEEEKVKKLTSELIFSRRNNMN